MLSLLFFSVQSKANSCSTEDYLAEGKKYRIKNNMLLAEKKLNAAKECFPDNSDVYVQLGYTYISLNENQKASQSFEKALSIAPNYTDAKYGLIYVALNQKDIRTAEILVNKFKKLNNDDIKLAELGDIITAIKKSEKNWSISLNNTHSRLTWPYANWDEWELSVTHKLDNKTSLTGNILQSNRFKTNDQKLGLTVWHTFNDSFYGYSSVLVSPKENFFPGYTVSAGGTLKLFDFNNNIFNVNNVTFDTKIESYKNGKVKTFTPGIEQYIYGDTYSIAAKWINVYDNKNKRVDGYLTKINIRPSEKFSFFIGYSDALETSERLLIRTKSRFSGITYKVSENGSISFSYANERKNNAYDSKVFSGGVTWSY